MATYRKVALTHIVEVDPMKLKARLVKESGKELAKVFKNFINANLFIYGKLLVIGWLISEGKVLAERHEYKTWKGNPKGTLIIFKDGSVKIGQLLDSEIAPKVDEIWFCCQGFDLFPKTATLNEGIKKEGYNPAQVGYSCNRLSIGYDGKKIIIAVRPHSDAARAQRTMENLGCRGAAICLDSGGSTNLVVEGKQKITTTRTLASIIEW